MSNGYETFKKYKVEAGSIEEFLDKYYKHDRYKGRGEEYAKCLLESHERDFNKYGYDIISHHDSVTGQVVAFYGRNKI